MKRRRTRRFWFAIAAGVVLVALLIVILVPWLSGLGVTHLPQDGTYQYGPATIIIYGYVKGSQRSDGPIVWQAVGGYFPSLYVAVNCTEDCSLLLEPQLKFPGFTVSGEIPGASYQEEVDLAAGETKTIVWTFQRVDSDDKASRLLIAVHDRSGQKDPGEVTFDLGEPVKRDMTEPPPAYPPTTTGP